MIKRRGMSPDFESIIEVKPIGFQSDYNPINLSVQTMQVQDYMRMQTKHRLSFRMNCETIAVDDCELEYRQREVAKILHDELYGDYIRVLRKVSFGIKATTGMSDETRELDDMIISMEMQTTLFVDL